MKWQRSTGRRAVLALALLLPAAFALTPATALAGSNPIRLTLFVGSPCFDGWATVGSTVSYKWKDATGDLIQQGEVQASDPGGLWYSECTEDFTGPLIEPGDRFVVSDGHFTRRFTIPDLTIQLNRVSDVIKGTAPAGTQVRIEYLFPAYPGWEIVTDAKKLPVHADGQWSFDITRYNDINGGDAAGMVWKSDSGDRVFMFADAPFIAVTIGKSTFSGDGNHYGSADTQLKDATTGDTKGSHSTTLGLNQSFTGTFRDTNGDPVAVAAGDRVVSDVAPDSSFVVPDIQFTTYAATDRVTGRGYVYSYANADGTFDQHIGQNNFPRPATLKSGDRVLVQCFMNNGDIVQKWGDVL
jgi:hypothetical protein